MTRGSVEDNNNVGSDNAVVTIKGSKVTIKGSKVFDVEKLKKNMSV